MNPYQNRPEKSFWKSAVAKKSLFDVSDLWTPKFKIKPRSPVSTFGSCFAQHIGAALKSRGYNWLITEKPPQGLSKENAKKFNYNVFTARTGNIYTTSLLKQWVEWATKIKDVPDEYWVSEGRYYDPFRPVVEPGGFSNLEEMKKSQSETIKSFLDSIKTSEYFVFTLGLTECWRNVEYGYEYPMCPGTAAGEYSADKHMFVNQQYDEVKRNLSDALNMMLAVNPKLKFILTVSPVPLTATNTDKNVIVATMYSKSVLRAVAGQVSDNRKYVDYFPSYEIINSPVFKGCFFEPNQRSVNHRGVSFVMDHFFSGLNSNKYYGKRKGGKVISGSEEFEKGEEVCEEELLEAFGNN